MRDVGDMGKDAEGSHESRAAGAEYDVSAIAPILPVLAPVARAVALDVRAGLRL